MRTFTRTPGPLPYLSPHLGPWCRVDERGRTPLHEASSRGNWQAVDYLLQGIATVLGLVASSQVGLRER